MIVYQMIGRAPQDMRFYWSRDPIRNFTFVEKTDTSMKGVTEIQIVHLDYMIWFSWLRISFTIITVKSSRDQKYRYIYTYSKKNSDVNS